ncbi:HAD family hydrolase [Streptomyces sp. ISL-43]|uniref:HAD family hydrolase n=1 Tax=Streptomyces sp. ISL-43 TaxID=2819183 RepID=UPI001BEA49AD|nr:HAD family hydrolase [Streptomyces sp. ISL-43]MBT2451986.1 HAD family hydrolase [Streptomyces sp. ISL-43]
MSTSQGAAGHIVFDFNGTLLDDNAARLRAVNDSLVALGVAPIGMARYRRAFCVPVPDFYARLLGRPLTAAECQTADGVFQQRYPDYAKTDSRLMPGAFDALRTWSAAGHTQSLLSLHSHDDLRDEVARLGLAGRFTLVDGRRGPTGGSKAESMRRHVKRLPLHPSRIVAIGDTQDDARAAAAAGIPAVLLSSGAQLADTLAGAGTPVAHSFAEAVDLAAGILGIDLDASMSYAA